jgi:enamine deaminase RidA (YjgF/YER057c/UK114 family)
METAGSSLEQVLKCNVYCTSVDKFAVVNEIYARYFPKDPPARIFINVPACRDHSTSRSTALRPSSLKERDNVLGHIRGPAEQGELERLSRQRENLAPRARESRRLRRQHSLQESEAGRLDPVAVELER